MTDTQLLTDLIQGIGIQLPVFIVAFIGAVVTLSRWKDAPTAGGWSLLGFGVAMLLCLLVPASQTGLRYWFLHNSKPPSSLIQAFTALALLWSLLKAASYIFLLAAIYAGRPKSA